jgi:hydroxyethylthiazole kinase
MPAEGEMRAPHCELPVITADILERLRQRRPRVHCITNAVAQTYTANVLLAAGAVPSMTTAPREVKAFVARADALLVNLGTFDSERQKAAKLAIAGARKAGTPWVLDPVFIDRSKPRAAFARSLLAARPHALRLNRAEFEALAGKAFDQTNVVSFARRHRTVVGLTGEVDRVADGERLATIANGDALMARVTAMGCAGSALVASCLAVEPDAFVATAAALVAMGVAGELAAARARGPGSFAIEMVDALYNLDRNALTARAKVS